MRAGRFNPSDLSSTRPSDQRAICNTLKPVVPCFGQLPGLPDAPPDGPLLWPMSCKLDFTLWIPASPNRDKRAFDKSQNRALPHPDPLKGGGPKVRQHGPCRTLNTKVRQIKTAEKPGMQTNVYKPFSLHQWPNISIPLAHAQRGFQPRTV